MPYAPPRCCKYPGCPNTTSHPSRLCKSHRKEGLRQLDRRRGSSTARGYDRKWRNYRIQFFKENPYCVHCLDAGRTRMAEEVDHIVPHGGDQELFWDSDNH